MSGRTIVTTIHQPSSDIFNIFDKLMLLSHGSIIYQVSWYFIMINKAQIRTKHRKQLITSQALDSNALNSQTLAITL